MPPCTLFTNNTNLRIGEYTNLGNVNTISGIECATFYFKFARRCETKAYNIPTDWTIQTMILNVKAWAKMDMPSFENVDENNIEVVLGGQYIPGIQQAEDAPKMDPELITIYEKFGNNYKNVHFYLRESRAEPIVPICSVCYQTNSLNSYFQCAHVICVGCNVRCMNNGLHSCPECRESRV